MTAHVPDIKRLQHVRLFEPLATLAATARGLDSPELDAQLAVMWTMSQLVEAPFCLLCEEKTIAPPLMGWADIPGGKAVFVVCWDCADAEAERLIFEKLGIQPIEHSGCA